MADKEHEPVKIGISVDNETANVIDELVLKVRRGTREGKFPRRGRGRSVGPGTIAATIVERVIHDYPQLLSQFFEEPTAPSAGEEPAPVEKSHPKESRKR